MTSRAVDVGEARVEVEAQIEARLEHDDELAGELAALRAKHPEIDYNNELFCQADRRFTPCIEGRGFVKDKDGRCLNQHAHQCNELPLAH